MGNHFIQVDNLVGKISKERETRGNETRRTIQNKRKLRIAAIRNHENGKMDALRSTKSIGRHKFYSNHANLPPLNGFDSIKLLETTCGFLG
ncbi:hypothetical protein F511_26312 [Dorcoceras hygrometricum]|uniref:Uncharacterized protein n=1 Tax=Dorcoceras hygrometricum TaxID=472368 RepID=A0A2Z7BVQ3_9LAMI|nr:hypothetical protein F511_26312 [Dorcoceras hygrometricum]